MLGADPYLSVPVLAQAPYPVTGKSLEVGVAVEGQGAVFRRHALVDTSAVAAQPEGPVGCFQDAADLVGGPGIRRVKLIGIMGEGKAPIGRKKPTTPWGYPALGRRTRKRKKYSDSFILRRRK